MLDTIVIGGGQAGLAMGYYLAQQGRDFRILDASPETGHVWRSRWDSLRLFTPAQYNSLPGYSFPYEHNYLPTKDEVADYLADYAERFELPRSFNQYATAITPVDDVFEVRTANREFVARNVVVATGPFSTPRIPAFAAQLDVQQIHSSEYRNPQQFAAGSRIMVVGAANSGVQIAAELAASHDVTLAASKDLLALPKFVAGTSIFWWLTQVGYFNSAVGTLRGEFLRKRDILVGESIAAAQTRTGFRRVGRALDAGANRIITTDGVVAVDAVVWATGYQPRRPAQTRGVSDVPGLYYLGLPWLHTRGSALLGWVGRDAEYLSTQLKPNTRRINHVNVQTAFRRTHRRALEFGASANLSLLGGRNRDGHRLARHVS